MRPLVSYYGGKQRMASKIVPLLPRHTVYVEPFCGGAAVFFAKPLQDAGAYSEVLNDADGRIANLYRCFADEELCSALIRRLQCTPYSRQGYKAAAETMDSRDPVEAAAATYVQLNCSFAHKIKGGWRTATKSRNFADTWVRRVATLTGYMARLEGVHIEHDDALAVIKRWDSPQTLFYCDPPYPGTNQGSYGGYEQGDFAALCDALDSCAGSFVLSCYDNPAARERWERFRFAATCTVSAKPSARTELIWRVDRSANAAPAIQDIWRKWEAAA